MGTVLVLMLVSMWALLTCAAYTGIMDRDAFEDYKVAEKAAEEGSYVAE